MRYAGLRPIRATCILPLAHGSVRTWAGKHQSQPGRLRYFLNRVPFHPSKQQPYIKFSEFSVLSVDKNWVGGRQPTPSFVL
jgi:hypothetical protein